MKKHILTIAALAGVGASAFADWTLLDDFEGADASTDAWMWQRSVDPVTENSMAILEDPSNPDNTCFAVVAGTAGNNSFVLDFGDNKFTDANEGTFFFRHLVPTIQTADGPLGGTLDLTIGLMSSSNYGGEVGEGVGPSWGSYSTIMRSGYNRFDIFDGNNSYKTASPASPADSGVWYSFWMVADVFFNTYEIYVQGGSDYPEQTLLTQQYVYTNPTDGSTSDIFVGDVAGFRVTSVPELDWFHLRYSSHADGNKGLHNGYFDDLYVDNTGANLTCPIDDCVGSGPIIEIVPSKLINISTRGRVGAAVSESLIGGFVIEGTEPMTVLVQAVGSELKDVPGTDLTDADLLANPVMIIQAADGSVSVTNDNWEDASNSADVAQAMIDAGANVLPTGSQSSSVLLTLQPGAYTAIVSGGGTDGIALVEAYEVSE